MNTNDPKDPSKQTHNPTTPPLPQGNYSKKNGENPQRSNPNPNDSKKRVDFNLLEPSNRDQTITYILLILGLLFMLFFNDLFGGLIIGGVAGYYFASQIVYYIRHIGQIVSGQDQLKYIVLTAVLLGLFIGSPGIFIGALIVAVFKQVFVGSQNQL